MHVRDDVGRDKGILHVITVIVAVTSDAAAASSFPSNNETLGNSGEES